MEPASHGRRIERLFFDNVILGAGFIAEAPHIVQRLIAIPAGALRLQRRNRCRPGGIDAPDGFSTLISMIRIAHDSPVQKYHSSTGNWTAVYSQRMWH